MNWIILRQDKLCFKFQIKGWLKSSCWIPKFKRCIYKHGIIIPDPDKKDYIKRCYELYATGWFSYERVAQELAKYVLLIVKASLIPRNALKIY